MRRVVVLAFVFGLFPVLSSSQTLTLSTNLDAVPDSFRYGPSILHRVDEDGDGVFDSFLQQARTQVAVDFENSGITIEYPRYRLIRVVDGQICRGAWLNPKQLAGVDGVWNEYFARVSLVTAGSWQELQVQYDTDADSLGYRWDNVKSFSIDRKWVDCQ